MLLTKAPFAELKPVRTTIAVATDTLLPQRTRTTLVPMNKKYFESSAGIVNVKRFIFRKTASVTGILDTGTDSPVSMDSFNIQSPAISIASHGTVFRSAISIKSPGTRSIELILRPKKRKWFNTSSRTSQYIVHTCTVAKCAHAAFKARHIAHPFHGLKRASFNHVTSYSSSSHSYLLCLDERGDNADSADQEDTKSIVIVIIHAPQQNARNLKNIERIKHLPSCLVSFTR